MTLPKPVQLPWTVAGRPVRPFHAALALATFTIGLQLHLSCNCALGRPPYDLLLSLACWVAAGLLLVGWLTFPFRKAAIWLTSWGALLALGVWSARLAYVLISENSAGLTKSAPFSAVLSFSWLLVALGVWLVERMEADYERQGEAGE